LPIALLFHRLTGKIGHLNYNTPTTPECRTQSYHQVSLTQFVRHFQYCFVICDPNLDSIPTAGIVWQVVTFMMTALDMSISPPSTSNIVPLREWSTNFPAAARLASPALGNRRQVAPTSHGGQTSRPSIQNGGTVRNGFKEIGLMSIKNSTLITTANGAISNIMHGI
jgi:hypothetical protein